MSNNYPHRVTIQEKSDPVYPNPATWSDLRSQWCRIGEPLGNRATAELSAAGAEITREIRFRDKPRVKIDQRVVWALHAFLIDAVATGTKQFTIEDDFKADFDAGDLLEIVESTGNDGYYTVASVAVSGGNTVITVNETVSSATADGKIKVLKVFTVSGVARASGGEQRVRVKEDQ